MDSVSSRYLYYVRIFAPGFVVSLYPEYTLPIVVYIESYLKLFKIIYNN